MNKDVQSVLVKLAEEAKGNGNSDELVDGWILIITNHVEELQECIRKLELHNSPEWHK